MKKYKRKHIALVVAILFIVLVTTIILPIFKSDSVIVETKNYNVTSDMMSYLMECELQDYVDYHTLKVGENYLETVSLDPNKNLKKQKSVYGGTWYDYFYDLSLEKAKTILASCEGAKRDNVSLSDDDEKIIETKASKINYKEYDISKENLKTILKYITISDKYKEYLASKLSDKDFEQYYNKNRKDYDCIDYKRVIVYADISGSSDSLEEATLKASEKADLLLAQIKTEGFDKPVERYLAEIGSTETIEDLTLKSQKYIESTQFTDWAFSDERKSGDAVIFAGKYQFSIYYLVSTPYPYDYTLTEGTVVFGKYDSSNPKALTELKTKLDSKVKNDEDLRKFSSDNSFVDIGLTKLYKEELPETVSLWLYSGSRKTDEIEVCTFGKNIYIMKYKGQGESFFKTKLRADCTEYEYNKAIEKLIKETDLKVS